MERSGRKSRLSFSLLRRRQQAASHRRFCIKWINKAVNKQVEKRIRELHSEFLLMNQAMREEMAAECQRQLEEARERPQHHTKVDQEWQMTSERLRKMEITCKSTDEDEEDEEKLQALKTLRSKTSKTSHRSDLMVGKPLKFKQLLFDAFSDSDSSSQPPKCRPKTTQQLSSDVCDTSPSMRGSEEGNSANPSFVTKEQSCEEEKVRVDGTKEEQLMDRQWKAWMDKWEMKGHHENIKAVDQDNTEKREAAAPCVSEKEKQKKQGMKAGVPVKKIKSYFSNSFTLHTRKWERLLDED